MTNGYRPAFVLAMVFAAVGLVLTFVYNRLNQRQTA